MNYLPNCVNIKKTFNYVEEILRENLFNVCGVQFSLKYCDIAYSVLFYHWAMRVTYIHLGSSPRTCEIHNWYLAFGAVTRLELSLDVLMTQFKSVTTCAWTPISCMRGDRPKFYTYLKRQLDKMNYFFFNLLIRRMYMQCNL